MAIANTEHRFMVAEQLRRSGVTEPTILLEPFARNTAPAVAAAALQALRSDPDAMLLVMPSDHAINDQEAFARAVQAGLPAARDGRLVTFGVVPRRPETGYGYIRYNPDEQASVKPVEAFVEKPDKETAQRYIQEPGYLWNSGIFLMDAATYLSELAQFRPQMKEACEAAISESVGDLDFLRLGEDGFRRAQAESIDFAVMENTEKAVVVPLDSDWSDLGSWDQIYELGRPDAEGNVVTGDVITEGTSDSYIHSQNRLVATLGVSDQVIVETSDAVLVADRAHAQDVKKIVQRLEDETRWEVDCHRRVYRPWGSYEGIAEDERFQVKRIFVHPGARLSVQMHYHRAEHWVVVSGTARVYCDEASFLLTENQSTYIPLGTKHCLENPGVIPLELIEIQSGAYLEEDDIVRFDDIYGRVEG
jgi:mannose-1-phosphate guanylyltransferase/mannose-6-phosphate isomerase